MLAKLYILINTLSKASISGYRSLALTGLSSKMWHVRSRRIASLSFGVLAVLDIQGAPRTSKDHYQLNFTYYYSLGDTFYTRDGDLATDGLRCDITVDLQHGSGGDVSVW